MPTMLRQPNGKACLTAGGKVRSAKCSRCHYIYYATWNCVTGAWDVSLSQYCGYCLPAWATSLDTWFKLSAGQYGWAHVGGSCICSGECNSPPTEPAAPSATPDRIQWAATWQCAPQTWDVRCVGATDTALSAWSSGVCSKSCVAATGTTPTTPAAPSDQSVCCKDSGGGVWVDPDPPTPCDPVNYSWLWTCDGVVDNGRTCVDPHDWASGKVCGNIKVTADNTMPDAPAVLPTCIHIWTISCAGDWSNYKLCLTDEQYAALLNGDPSGGLPRGSGSGWIMDPINCRWIRWTIGDDPPPDPGPCPTYVYHWEAKWDCTATPNGWKLTKLANTPHLTAAWASIEDHQCVYELYTTDPGTPAAPTTTPPSPALCCGLSYWWSAFVDCKTGVWDIIDHGLVTHDVQTWQRSDDPCSVEVDCYTADHIRPAPPSDAIKTDICTPGPAPCSCTDVCFPRTAYSVSIGTGWFGTTTKWTSVYGIPVVGSCPTWSSGPDESPDLYVDLYDSGTLTDSHVNATLKIVLNGSDPCQWEIWLYVWGGYNFGVVIGRKLSGLEPTGVFGEGLYGGGGSVS